MITGGIGAGKTRVAEGIAAALVTNGIAVGGVLSPRVMQGNETVGYTVRDLTTRQERPFAGREPPGIRVGKFFIDPVGLIFARDAIDRAVRTAAVVFIDEVGKLEIAGAGLAAGVEAALTGTAVPILLVRTEFVAEVRARFSLPRFVELEAGRDA